MSEHNEESGLKWLLKEGRSQIIGWGIGKALPFGATVVVTVCGAVEKFPWFYICCGAAFVFAMTAIGMYIFNMLVYQMSAKSKLILANGQLQLQRDESEGKQTITSGAVAVILQNNSIFPIEYYVKEIRTVIGGKVNTKPTYLSREGTVYPGNPITYHDDYIHIEPKPGQLLEASIKVIIKYGFSKKKLNQTIEGGFKIFGKFNGPGDVIDISCNHDN